MISWKSAFMVGVAKVMWWLPIFWQKLLLQRNILRRLSHSFGAERRGAPVTAFVRFSKSPFKRRSAIEYPQALIIQDPHLLNLAETMHGFDANGTLVINTGRSTSTPPHHAAGKVIAFPATEMAEEILGRPIPNVALVAAFMGALNIFPIDGLEKALERRFPKAVADKNIALARKCYQLGGELYAST